MLPSELSTYRRAQELASALGKAVSPGIVRNITRSRSIQYQLSSASVGAVYAELPDETDPQFVASSLENDATLWAFCCRRFGVGHMRRDGVKSGLPDERTWRAIGSRTPLSAFRIQECSLLLLEQERKRRRARRLSSRPSVTRSRPYFQSYWTRQLPAIRACNERIVTP